jgi:hypothetical protein
VTDPIEDNHLMRCLNRIADLEQENADLRASNVHSLRLLAAAEARCAGLERTVRDLLAELIRRGWDEVSGAALDPARAHEDGGTIR